MKNNRKMINAALYKREMKGSLKMLFLFAAIISMYVTIIISMYDPEMMATLDSFYEVMPELMASLGMGAGKRPYCQICGQRFHGYAIGIAHQAPDHCHDAAVRSHQRNLAAYCLCDWTGNGSSGNQFPGRAGSRRSVNIKRCPFMPAFIYWRNLFSGFLHFFRYKIQYCFRSRHSGTYVYPSDAGECRRKGRYV